ncbi:MAG: hypothetical protein JOY91_07000, partial [Sinobacteraceae bacterium]|nr:hypothetical protein [Nevskiaceae bacterium]
FTVFVAIFLTFLYHLARVGGNLNAWLMVVAALIIDSSSNSLGVWTNDLMVEVAFVMAIAGYRDYVPVRVIPRLARMMSAHRRPAGQGGLTLLPGPFRAPGLHGAITPRR